MAIGDVAATIEEARIGQISRATCFEGNAAIAAFTDSTYALAAGAVAPALARARGVRRAGRWLGGSAFIGLGVFTALTGSHGAR